MNGIEVRESGSELLVELWGEFDLFCSEELTRTLAEVSSRRGTVLIDLSGISFIDLQSARELAVHALLYPRRLTFRDPSPQVMATLGALGLEGWLAVPPDAGRDEPHVFSNVV